MLVSDAKHLIAKGINAHEDPEDQPNVDGAVHEHEAVVVAFKRAGIKIEQVDCPPHCQDGVFTANWGLTWNGRALLSRLPNLRQPEEPVADAALQGAGFETKRATRLFSGQGDAMIIGGNRVLMGDGFRTDARMAPEIKAWLGLEPIVVKAKPKRYFGFGWPVRNKVTGLWDSYFYDIDIAIAVLRPDLIAVCHDALTSDGRAAIAGLSDVEIIPVSESEAKYALGCNLVSTGATVIMVDEAPQLTEQIEKRGLKTIRLTNHELRKNGGGFRCISLSLY